MSGADSVVIGRDWVRPVPGPRAAVGGFHLGEWAAELAGTAVLVLGGLSAAVLDFSPRFAVVRCVPSVSARLLLTGFLFAGTGALVTVSPLGRRSGAHLNPALTIAFTLTGHVHRHDLAGYLVAQFSGGLLGAALLRAAWGDTARVVGDGVTAPGPRVSEWQAVALEAGMTAGLVLTVFLFVSSARTARWAPLAVWVVVAVLVWRGAPVTGASLNPARSLGPAVVTADYQHLWVYFLGPIGGALAAVAVWRLVPRSTLTAKLFHDRHRPSTLRTELPALPPAHHPTLLVFRSTEVHN